jgi:hypothetical protein
MKRYYCVELWDVKSALSIIDLVPPIEDQDVDEMMGGPDRLIALLKAKARTLVEKNDWICRAVTIGTVKSAELPGFDIEIFESALAAKVFVKILNVHQDRPTEFRLPIKDKQWMGVDVPEARNMAFDSFTVIIESGRLLFPSNPNADRRSAIIDLLQRGFKVESEDEIVKKIRRDFVKRQVSCDLMEAAAELAKLYAMCDALSMKSPGAVKDVFFSEKKAFIEIQA